MLEETTQIGGRSCRLFRSGATPRALLVQPAGVRESPDLPGEAELVAAACGTPFALAAFEINHWDAELLPWPDPAVSLDPGTAPAAADTLGYVRDALLPVLRQELGELPVVIGGYSLGALFALWAACETPLFAAVAACSPSLWVNGWDSYAERHPTRAAAVYLSLGDREGLGKAAHASSPHFAGVAERVRSYHERLVTELGGDHTVLEWNSGGHFSHCAERTARGFAWALDHCGGLRRQ